MAESLAERLARADRDIHDMGTLWMVDSETTARGATLSYPSRMAFYFAGRGGVLGDVDANVIAAAMGWWEPGRVREHWDAGRGIVGPREAARQYGRACAWWGEDHLTNVGLDHARLAELAGLAERAVDQAEQSGLPLFAGWRAEPRSKPGPGRLLQQIHLLRELRGGRHLAATTAAGLEPLAAILAKEGPAQAELFGWGSGLEPRSDLRPLHDAAEATTNRLMLAGYRRALTEPELERFAGLVTDLGAAVLPRRSATAGTTRTARTMPTLRPGPSRTSGPPPH
ncbi:MAG: SCO6745 family protein [Mycobacteriales bacterium]